MMAPTSLWRPFALYGILGLSYAMCLQYGFSHRDGKNWTRLISIGESSPFRSYIEPDFDGPISFVSGVGHDGQWTWIVARHPFHAPDKLCDHEHPGCDPHYRYRRIFVSLLAGGAGTFSVPT